MCAAPVYWNLRQFGICRRLCRGRGSPGDLQYPGYYQRVDRDTIHFAYPGFHKDYLLWGPWCAFLFTKVTTASPHTIQEYQPWHGFCISKLLNPQPAAPGQDALGLITIYPRPDEHFIISAAAPAAAAPSITAFLLGRTPRLQRLSQPFSIQDHLTILIGWCQLIQKFNRITVYPFIHKRVNRYKVKGIFIPKEWRFLLLYRISLLSTTRSKIRLHCSASVSVILKWSFPKKTSLPAIVTSPTLLFSSPNINLYLAVST